MKYPGIVIKLWFTIIILVMSVLLALGVTVSRLMDGLYYFHLSEHMTGQAQGLIRLYAPDPESPGTRPWLELETVIGARITTLSVGELLSLAEGKRPGRSLTEMARRLLAGQTANLRERNPVLPCTLPHDHGTAMADGAPEVFMTGVPIMRSGELRGALVLCSPVSPVTEAVTRFRQILAGVAAAILAVVTLMALFLSRRISRPLLEMDRMARAMSAGDFRQRVRVAGRDEVGRLGESINSLAAVVEHTIQLLAEQNSRLSGILSSMSDAVFLADLNGQVRFLNAPALALARQAGLGCSEPGCVENWTCLEQLGIGAPVRRVVAGTGPLLQRVPLGGFVYAVHLTPLQDDGGRVHGAVAVWQDVTQEERLEEMRREFVANVSHEMRTPISLVRGYVEALQDGLDQSVSERDEMLSIITEELDRLEHLVTDLLELARLNAGQIRLHPEPVSLGPLIAHMTRKLTPLIQRTGVRVQPEVPPGLPLVPADPDRLEQILLNLLENALRHSPPGTAVTVTAAAGDAHMTVRAQDQGPGISPAERHLVWERFYRGDPARSRRTGGTGLGLAIVRGLVTAHGGRVWVEDAPGGGSAFCFTLPLDPSREPPA